MLTHRFYYELKPYLPWRLRMGLRRATARRKRPRYVNVWPIDESASRRPDGWQGWPQGNRFALVLTHDVESFDGLQKCRALAELERSMGFRSCFNFIPEGAYRVSAEFRSELLQDGFEVGVHDLKHDGKLFLSRRTFEQRAGRINSYLSEWGASGFRSGFMLRNLEWLHDLDIRYDSSTFDTDPFELQSDGAGTIFPFWVGSPGGNNGNGEPHAASGLASARTRGGYVELPYTLPQDSTLFLVLRETTPDIWINKLDWVARHGGMALVNVHPDYMSFKEHCRHDEYPMEHFAKLLQHIRARYAGQFWCATPKQVTDWYHASSGDRNGPTFSHRATTPLQSAASAAASNLAGRRAGVLLFSNYPSDPRPRRAAEALTSTGMKVDLLCLADDSTAERTEEEVHGVHVSRIQLRHRRDSKMGYLWQYGRFFFSSLIYLTRQQLRRRYDVVHVHNMPDLLVFATIVPKLFGAKIVLDLHDPMPELMMSIYQLEAADWRVRILRSLERWSIAYADLVLTPNESFRQLFISRGCRPGKMQIVMNAPEESIFDPDRVAAPVSRSDGEFRVMHHGSILHRHGVDLLVEAIAQLQPRIPGLHLDIYGFRDPFLDTVLAVAARLNVGDIVRYHGPKTQQQIAEAIRQCDVGVVPNRATPFTAINFPTRIFEYLSLGCPAIAPATQGIHDYFAEGEIITFTPNSVDDLARRILWVHDNRREAHEIMSRGANVYRQHLWSGERSQLLRAVSSLVNPNRAPAHRQDFELSPVPAEPALKR